MHILVTGGAGYIGSVLICDLLKKGHKVKCLDRFFFGKESLADISANSSLELIQDDRRWFDPDLLNGVDAVIRVYVFNKSVFEAVNNIKPSWRNELEIVDVIQYLVDNGKNVTVRSVRDWWKDTDKPEDLLEANQLILQDLSTSIEGSIDDHSGIVGSVSIGRGTKIENSRIRGPVIIGSNCEIGSNTYLGPYTAVGDNCRIVGSELENSIVMESAVIDCGNRIVDSIIGKNSKITSDEGALPKGMKFVVGDSTYLSL